MKNRKSSSHQPIVYIKLPAYEIPYMVKMHGRPLVFGSVSDYSVCLTNHLVCNKYLDYKYTDLSYSEYAFSLAASGPSAQQNIFEQISVPNIEDVDKFVAVAIPHEVIARDDEGKCQAIETNKHFQFTRLGAQRFRELAHNEFWRALLFHIRSGESEFLKQNVGTNIKVSRRQLIIEFMEFYKIPIEHVDTICRNIQREIKKL